MVGTPVSTHSVAVVDPGDVVVVAVLLVSLTTSVCRLSAGLVQSAGVKNCRIEILDLCRLVWAGLVWL